METKIAKFTGTIEMEQALDRMIQVANNGFAGGKISKHDLVSWALLYFEKQCFQDCIEKIRQDHFDQLTYLESVLKQAKQARRNGGEMPDIASLLSAIAPSTNLTTRKKRSQASDSTEPGTAKCT